MTTTVFSFSVFSSGFSISLVSLNIVSYILVYNIVSRVGVTVGGVWIGEWIY
jgi:hypothetical protein